MEFYTNVDMIGHKILHRYVDDNGERQSEWADFKPTLFTQSIKPSEYRDIQGNNVVPMVFDGLKEAKDEIKFLSGISNSKVYGDIKWTSMFINDRYFEPVKFDMRKLAIANIDIETEMINFKAADWGDKQLFTITVGVGGRYYAFGYKNFTGKLKKNAEYIHCDDEADLFMRFLKFWGDIEPNIVTGWNCLPIDSNIFGKNEIVKLSNVSVGMELCDSTIENISPVSNKELVEVRLANGHVIRASNDHIFPVKHIDGCKYTQLVENSKNKEFLVSDDLAIKDFPLEKSIFVEVPILTNMNIDVEISDDILYLLGFIFTDGTLCTKGVRGNGFKVYQSDYKLLETFDTLLSTEIVGSLPKGYSRRVKHSLISEYVDLIYNDMDSKELNINLLSKLSYNQFMVFLSGMLDGDGYVSSNGIELCNYDNSINSIYDLCCWNGIFTTICENSIRFIDIKFDDLCLRKSKRWQGFNYSMLNRDSSQKAEQIRYKKVGNSYFVRVTDISHKEVVQMMDIETDTHYFNAHGVKVHNCDGFDIPFLIMRIRNLFGNETANRLAPTANKFTSKCINEREFDGKIEYSLVGIEQLDLMQMYKKFTFKMRESYSLNYISHVELGEEKIHYSGNLEDLYHNDFNKFIIYNIKDVELVDRIDAARNLMLLVLTLGYMSHIKLADTFYQLRMWDSIIYNRLLHDKVVVPGNEHSSKTEKYQGAYVNEPKVGFHDWVVSFDLNSLYPHIIEGMNISPETQITENRLLGLRTAENSDSVDYISSLLIDNKIGIEIDDMVKGFIPEKLTNSLVDLGIGMSANGCLWDNSNGQGFLGEIMHEQYQQRKTVKKEMLTHDSNAELIKTILNGRK